MRHDHTTLWLWSLLIASLVSYLAPVLGYIPFGLVLGLIAAEIVADRV